MLLSTQSLCFVLANGDWNWQFLVTQFDHILYCPYIQALCPPNVSLGTDTCFWNANQVRMQPSFTTSPSCFRFPSFFLQEYRHHIDSSSEILENSKRLCALRTTLVMTRQVQSENTDVTKMLSSSSAYISFSLVRSIVPLCTDDWSVEFKH
ncbi:hypothetical protein V6N13_106611 [Hibiscus sabdariffa]